MAREACGKLSANALVAFKPVHKAQQQACDLVVSQLLRSSEGGDLLDAFIKKLCAPKSEVGGPEHLMSLLVSLRSGVILLPAMCRDSGAKDGAASATLANACAELDKRLAQHVEKIDLLEMVKQRKAELRLQSAPPQSEASAFPPLARNRKRTEEEHCALRSKAVTLVARMEIAAEADDAARKAGTMGFAKLSMVEHVEQQLCHTELPFLCMEHNLLGALASWLRPLGMNGSLPTPLLTPLLTLCSRLPIDMRLPCVREWAKDSGLGKVVNYYSVHEKDVANRTRAKELVSTWSRPIFDCPATYQGVRHRSLLHPAGAARASAADARSFVCAVRQYAGGENREAAQQG